MKLETKSYALKALLFVGTTAVGVAAETSTVFTRLDLLDGRKLTNVAIKSYDSSSGRVLLIADRKAMTVPIALIPSPFAEQFRAGLSEGGSTTTVVPAKPAPASAAQPPNPPAVRVAPSRVAKTMPARREIQAASGDLAAHLEAVVTRAERFFRYEHKAGSDSISVTAIDIETEEPVAVTGWEGRYRTAGKAYLEYYDSKGRSFQRTTSGFHVITEQKPGKAVTVVEFRLSSPP